jgi:hypothetical protein
LAVGSGSCVSCSISFNNGIAAQSSWEVHTLKTLKPRDARHFSHSIAWRADVLICAQVLCWVSQTLCLAFLASETKAPGQPGRETRRPLGADLSICNQPWSRNVTYATWPSSTSRDAKLRVKKMVIESSEIMRLRRTEDDEEQRAE